MKEYMIGKQGEKPSVGKRIIRWLIGIVLGFIAFSVLQVLIFKWAPVWRTPLMVRRQIEARQEGRQYSIHKQWVSLDDISHELPCAVIASEDNLFQVHNGFSERGIRQAIEEKLAKGEVRHGGSTISQQTAKNVFTSGRRTFVRKAFEAYYTFLIEKIWGKRRIMEVYLNVIEMGDGVFGAEAASQQFFHHKAAGLTRREASLIAACLPNPRKMHADSPSAYVQKRQRQIAALIPKLGKIDLDTPENSSIVKNHRKK